jgi:hypothetical protein
MLFQQLLVRNDPYHLVSPSARRRKLKKLIFVTFGIALMMSLMAIAQETTKQDTVKQDSMTSSPISTSPISTNPMSISGKVSDDGKTFVSDNDSKSWTVSNPEALKGHEGHQVTVSANVNADKNEVQVLSVKMIEADRMK